MKLLYDYISNFYRTDEFPALAEQIALWSETRPFDGIKILDATPVFRNTLVKYLALLSGGAELTVAIGEKIPADLTIFNMLPEFGIRAARTTELGLWDKAKTDPMRVPCFAVSENDENNFYAAVELANEDENCAVTILYHGVPDLAHPWCNTPEDMFAKHMKYLADNDFCVISMKDFSGR